ncbi:hypothetical protein CJF42_05655 [Pseudoalteromonas sp. NBT06-2]|nr:hypothetical protein CJF42_05655 [Pseudoalteromonas sp. NBT06-2]
MNYRLNITFRSLAAILGGYALAVASSFALVPIFMYVFGCFKADAVYLGTIFSYVFYFSCVIFSFNRASVLLVWRDITLICLVFYLIHYIGTIL